MTNVQKGKYTKNITVVKLKKLKESLVQDALSIKLPSDPNPLEVESILFEYSGKDDYTWSGKFKKGGGNMILVSKPEGIMGAIQYDNRFFLLQPLKNNFCMLVEQDITTYERGDCKSDNVNLLTRSASSLIDNGCNLQDGTSCSATIDILLLVSNNARTWINTNLDFWGQVLFVPLMQASINTSFQNSGIPNKQVRVRVAPDLNFSTSASIDNDLNLLIGNSSAIALRNQYRADIVVGLTNQGYDSGNLFGKAGTLSVNTDSAYAIVEINQAITGRWTFAHEFAHILGARHNRLANGGNDNSSVCGHGFRFNDAGGIERRTILALLGTGQRILNFSNPDIVFNGAVTGSNTAGTEANNARMIRNTGCIAANFRPSPEMSAFISTSGDICSGMSLSAIIDPPAPGITVGVGPYSFEWFLTQSSYFDPSNLIGTDQTISLFYPGLPFFWVHVRITSSDGAVKVVSKRINSYCNAIIATPTEKANTSYQGAIYPNPSSGVFYLEMDAIEDSNSTNIEIVNIQGSKIKTIKREGIDKGWTTLKIDLSDAPNGIYFCKIQDSKEIKTIKLIKN